MSDEPERLIERRVVTDEMCRRAIAAMGPDRIQGFSTPHGKRSKWGAPHWVRDVSLPADRQELWRGESHSEMIERCEIERMRLALNAALSSCNYPECACIKRGLSCNADSPALSSQDRQSP